MSSLKPLFNFDTKRSSLGQAQLILCSTYLKPWPLWLWSNQPVAEFIDPCMGIKLLQMFVFFCAGPPGYMAGGPIRQPYAGVDFIPQSGIMNSAAGVLKETDKELSSCWRDGRGLLADISRLFFMYRNRWPMTLHYQNAKKAGFLRTVFTAANDSTPRDDRMERCTALYLLLV